VKHTKKSEPSSLPSEVKRTGVFLSDEEFDEVQELNIAARNTPAIWLGGSMDWATKARQLMQERLNEIAMSHGLPDKQDFYGLDLNGEVIDCRFLKGKGV
jgi:hypothetical protein